MRHLFYYKMRQKFITKCDSYYKIQRLLQIPTVHCYKTDVSSIICGHHVYKEAWDAAIGEILEAALDDREEAKEYDKYSVRLYKKISRWTYTTEILSLRFRFIIQDPGNK